MRSIRGFRGEGQTLGGEGAVSSSQGQRQLRDSQRQLGNRHHVTGDSGGVTSHGDHVTEKDESGDRHVTEQSEERGRVVTLGLRLKDRTVRKQFYTTDTVQVTLTSEFTLYNYPRSRTMYLLNFLPILFILYLSFLVECGIMNTIQT